MDQTQWVDIMRTGTFADTNGRKATFAEADLDRMVQSFDENRRRVPLVFGHPKMDDPAYGWVAALRRAGDVLQAAFKQVPDVVRSLIAAGRYKNISVALFPNGTLRHVGLLGAAQPAIDGLREVRLGADGDFAAFEFSAGPDFGRTQLLQAQLEDLQQKLFKAFDDLKAEREKGERLAMEFAEKEATIKDQARAERFSKLVAAGKALPAERTFVYPLADALSKAGGLMFSDGKGGEEAIGMEELLFRYLESRPPVHACLFQELPAGSPESEADAANRLTNI